MRNTFILLLMLIFMIGGCFQNSHDALFTKIAVMEDSKNIGDGLLAGCLHHNSPQVRARAAIAAGRIGDASIIGELSPLITAADETVRAEAIFALGQIGDSTSLEALTSAFGKIGSAEDALILEAAAKINCASADSLLTAQLQSENPDHIIAAVKALTWKRSQQNLVNIAPFFNHDSTNVRLTAYYAAYRMADSTTAGLLLEGLTGTDPRIRKYAAGGIGRAGIEIYAQNVIPLLNDNDPAVRIHAIRCTGRCKVIAAVPKLLEAAAEPEYRIYREALEALGNIGAEIAVEPLEKMMKSESSEKLRFIIPALARIEGDRFLPFLETYADYPDPTVRESAAAALSHLQSRGAVLLTKELTESPDPPVRMNAFLSLDQQQKCPPDYFVQALNDTDWTVRTIGAEIIGQTGDLTLFQSVSDCFDDHFGKTEAEETAAMLRCLFKLDTSQTIKPAQKAFRSSDPALKQTAKEILIELDIEIEDPDQIDFSRYLQDFGLPPQTKYVSVLTSRGRFVLELFTAEAPLVTKNFITLINRRFYDGLKFHRVVPDFVVQGGDPRGDGWGGPGYTVRDQINRRKFTRGTVGLPSSGLDTGGCQIFICLSEQPHLDGRYTAFGQVVKGMNILDNIGEGDSIVEIRIIEEHDPKFIEI